MTAQQAGPPVNCERLSGSKGHVWCRRFRELVLGSGSWAGRSGRAAVSEAVSGRPRRAAGPACTRAAPYRGVASLPPSSDRCQVPRSAAGVKGGRVCALRRTTGVHDRASGMPPTRSVQVGTVSEWTAARDDSAGAPGCDGTSHGTWSPSALRVRDRSTVANTSGTTPMGRSSIVTTARSASGPTIRADMPTASDDAPPALRALPALPPLYRRISGR
jgi:hypothetical protein